MQQLGALLRFSRLHTIIATTVQTITIFLIVGGRQAFDPATWHMAALAWLAALALNVYVVGLNQLTDVAIDRVNKPRLPLASGEFSLAQGWAITIGAGLIGLLAAFVAGPYLLATIVLIMLIGSLYSLPPRLKRFPLLAALSIATARGVVSNLGMALHFGSLFAVRIPIVTLIMLGLFFFGFGLVIAFYKDLPDQEGDRAHNIPTFANRLGPQRVILIGKIVLTACYALPIAVAIGQLPAATGLFLLVSHSIIIGLFWWLSGRVDLRRQQSLTVFYRFLWLMFYSEFLVLSIYELSRTSA